MNGHKMKRQDVHTKSPMPRPLTRPFFFVTGRAATPASPGFVGSPSMEEGKEGARGRLGGNGGKVGRCVPDRRARGGQGRTSCPSALCPFGCKRGPNLGLEWVASGQKKDICPFAPARWTTVCVRLPPNERGRTFICTMKEL